MKGNIIFHAPIWGFKLLVFGVVLLMETSIKPVGGITYRPDGSGSTSFLGVPKKAVRFFFWVYVYNWAALSDEQMSKGWPFSLLNDE